MKSHIAEYVSPGHPDRLICCQPSTYIVQLIQKGLTLLYRGKDPHKVDVAGAFRARELALRLLKERGGNAITVRLGWTAGDATPAFREAENVDSLGLTHPIPASALPPKDWFSIASIVTNLRLASFARREKVLSGYFRS